jgi:hypothetical protein
VSTTRSKKCSWTHTREHFVQQDAQHPPVDCVAITDLLEHFWRHVLRRRRKGSGEQKQEKGKACTSGVPQKVLVVCSKVMFSLQSPKSVRAM